MTYVKLLYENNIIRYLFIFDHFVIEQRVQLFVKEPIKGGNCRLITSNQSCIYDLRNAKKFQILGKSFSLEIVTLCGRDQPIGNASLCLFALSVSAWKSFRVKISDANRTHWSLSIFQGKCARNRRQSMQRTQFQMGFPPKNVQ